MVLVLALVATPALVAAQPRRPAKKVDIDKARAALIGPDPAQAALAATELGASRDVGARGALLDALATGVHPDVAVAALTALATAPVATDLATVKPYAKYRTPRVRAAAVRALARHEGASAEVLLALRDQEATVRAAAAEAAASARVKGATEPLLALLDKGEVSAGLALGALADADLARVIAEHLGTAPDAVLAQSLGAILSRPDFTSEPARVQVVRTVAKLAGPEAISALTEYVDATPAKPPKQSRREAEAALKTMLGGD